MVYGAQEAGEHSVVCSAGGYRVRLRERMDVSGSSAHGLLCWSISAVDGDQTIVVLVAVHVGLFLYQPGSYQCVCVVPGSC